MKVLASLPLWFVVSSSLVAQTPPPPLPREAAMSEMISVSGVGRVRLTPDRVAFTVGVETIAPTVEDAVAQNGARVDRVLSALRKAGAKDEEIRTSNFAIYPQQIYAEGRAPKITGYQVSNSIKVTRDKPADAGRMLQAAVAAGVNQASGLEFTVSDQRRGQDQGLSSAFEDARSKAAALAKSAGRSLGRAISITEGGAAMHPRPMLQSMSMKAEGMQAEVSMPIEPGSEERVFTVSVIFEMR